MLTEGAIDNDNVRDGQVVADAEVNVQHNMLPCSQRDNDADNTQR